MKSGKFANHYTNGVTLKSHYCIECHKKVTCYSKRCFKCAIKKLWSDRKCSNWHPKNFNGGFTCCVDCGKQTHSWVAKRCMSCANKIKAKNSWRRPKFREKMIKILLNNQQKAIQGLVLHPNKPEKVLLQILPNSFVFVGNGKKMIDRFNPDFIDEKNKKIVEMYGDYWHNLKSYKERDLRRLKAYKKAGYALLIIWEHELKDASKVKQKVKEFYGR